MLGAVYLSQHRFREALEIARRARDLRRNDAWNYGIVGAVFTFPNYPLAMVGQGNVKAARGDRDGALMIYVEQLKRTPTLDLAARIGDLYEQEGNSAQAEHYYRLAEDLAGPGIAQTESNLALFLAEHDRKLPEAVTIAEAVAAVRHDIFTEDALAWAYYQMPRRGLLRVVACAADRHAGRANPVTRRHHSRCPRQVLKTDQRQ
jgi:tetratricopeptide (TPR) repeat protein